MRVSAMLAGFGLLGLVGNAHAARIASPAIFASPAQQTAQCTIGNLGLTPISATVDIVDELGFVVTTTPPCGTIEPFSSCQVSAAGIHTFAIYACTATVQGSASKVRGNIALLDAGGFPLRTAGLR